MPRTTKKGKHSTQKNPCPLCGNTTGSCKLNDDGSIYCYHCDPHSAPSGYVYIRELSGGMGQEFIDSHLAPIRVNRKQAYLQHINLRLKEGMS